MGNWPCVLKKPLNIHLRLKILGPYALLALGSILIFAALVPIVIIARIDIKEVGFFVWLATLIFIGAPLAGAVASLGIVVIQMAGKNHPETKAIVDWFDRLKFFSKRAGQHLAKIAGFFLIIIIALFGAYCTGWWDLFDSNNSISTWPWYNFIGLVLGGAFSSFLIYHAIKSLGRPD